MSNMRNNALRVLMLAGIIDRWEIARRIEYIRQGN